MWKDPIVEETRQLRKQYLASCGNSPDAVFLDILNRQRQPGENIVSRPARPVQQLRKIA